MYVLPKLVSLLINIDQETVLNFFGVNDPTSYLTSNLDKTQVSTDVSLETLKLVFQGILERYQHGLGLIDIENLILFITFVRFIILAIRYNIKTSFYICCISLFASMIWYFHIKDLFAWYGDLMVDTRLTNQVVEDLISVKSSEQAFQQSDAPYLSFANQDPVNFIKSSWLYSTERGNYRIDPISMLVTNVPDAYKEQIQKIYYLAYGKVIPSVWKIFDSQLKQLLPIIVYLVVVRLNKKYCPYLIRWHWTFLIVFNFVEDVFLKLIYRLWIYQNNVLIPTERYEDSALVQVFFMSMVSLHYLFIWFGLLHAACGQYFYMPFLTENTEIHIGKRAKDSIYSGGYTSWQDGLTRKVDIMVRGKKRFTRPRIWWGWFGKTKYDLSETEYRQKRQQNLRKKQNKGFRKLFRRLKRWILRG